MRTNLSLYLLCTLIICQTALSNNNSELHLPSLSDGFQSPATLARTIALAPLSEFFNRAKEMVAIKSPQVHPAQTQSFFYSQMMSLYINNVYNNPLYADQLSQDGRHITQFLQLSNEFNLTAEQTYTSLRLFHNKLKETDFIDDTVTNHVLEALPLELERHFPMHTASKPKGGHHSPTKLVENILLSEFTDHLTQPRVSTDQIFKQISERIVSTLGKNQQSDEEMMKERLRNITMQLVEQLISKTMWYPDHYEGIWQSVLNIAHNIHLLCANGIVNHMDDRDNMIKSLTAHFISFVKLYANKLPISFYEHIEHDIENHLVFFLESDELDEGILSKKELLQSALANAKTQAIAYQKHGIIRPE